MLSRFPLGVKFMWLVTENGFFNIVQSDDDADKGLLTIKGRRIEDLEKIKMLLGQHVASEIQTSYKNDYHFRIKADAAAVGDLVGHMVKSINYNKTKPRLHRRHPDRAGIYLSVWEELANLQR